MCVLRVQILRFHCAKPPKFLARGAERHRPTCTPGLGGQAQVLRSFWRDGSLKFLTLEVLNAHPELYVDLPYIRLDLSPL